MSFSDQISRFGKRALNNIAKTKRGTALSMFGKIVMRTPVGSPSLWESSAPKGYTGGRLRANWQISINQPAQGVIDAVAHRGEELNAYRAKGDDSIFITNNLPYALRVEMGHSKQRPQGMVRVTLKEFKRTVRSHL